MIKTYNKIVLKKSGSTCPQQQTEHEHPLSVNNAPIAVAPCLF